MGENICKLSDWQGIHLKICKQLMQLNLKKNVEVLKRYFSKEDMQMAKKHMNITPYH